jgi:hypothetical protein
MSSEEITQVETDLNIQNEKLCELQQQMLQTPTQEAQITPQITAVEAQINKGSQKLRFLREGPESNPDCTYTIEEMEGWLRKANDRLCELQAAQLKGGDVARQMELVELAIDGNRTALSEQRKATKVESVATTKLRNELIALRGELDAAQQQVAALAL